MAAITFTDGIGAATLRPCAPATTVGQRTAGRLRGWVPSSRAVTDAGQALATGITYAFRYRTDYGASFTVPAISAHYDAALACFPLEVADRLVAHLLAGGFATLATEDANDATYTVAIAPGSSPSLSQTDPRALEYALSLSVIRVDGVAAPMTCRYGRTS